MDVRQLLLAAWFSYYVARYGRKYSTDRYAPLLVAASATAFIIITVIHSNTQIAPIIGLAGITAGLTTAKAGNTPPFQLYATALYIVAMLTTITELTILGYLTTGILISLIAIDVAQLNNWVVFRL